MQNLPGSHDRHVHFGEVEDILSTSFYNEGLNDTDGPENEEEKKKKDINARVVKALETDDVSMLKQLLVEIPELETYIERPLAHLAAQYGALKILQECVSKPADSINAASADFDATTPLYWAIKEGHAAVADWLLGAGAFHQPLNVYQDTAVYVAVYHSQEELLNVLWAHNCDCNTPNRNGDIPLMHVIRTGNIQALDMLIKMGVDVYGGNRENGSAMGLAIQMPGKEDIITRLISAGFDVNKDHTLLDAVKADNVSAIKAILPHNNNPDVLTAAANSALINSTLSVVKVLVEAGAEVDINRAIRAETGHILTYLLGVGVGVQGKCVLYRCVYYCTLRTQKYESASCGAYAGYFRQREVLYSSHAAYRRILQTLMDFGAGLDEVYHETGVTALRHSAAGGLVCMTLDLLRAGCSPSIPDNNGRTALQYTLEDCGNNYLSSNKRRRLTAIAAILTEFMPYFSHEPAVKQILCNPVGNLPKELLGLLRDNTAAPRALQHLCRWTLLHTLRPQAHLKVGHLGLPQRLVDYLLLADLCDLNFTFADLMKPSFDDFCYYHRVLDPAMDKDPCPTVCACDPTGLTFPCKLT